MSKGDLTRTKILDRALVLASRLGFEGLTLGVLADSLGLSKSGLYAHFRSKEALVLAVLDRTLARHLEHVAPYLEGQEPGLAELRAYLHAWLDWTASKELPAGCPILGATFEFEDVAGSIRDRLLAINRGSRAKLEALIRRAIASGELSAELPMDQFLFELRGIALTFHQEHRFMQNPEARQLAEAVQEGLLARYAVTPSARMGRRAGRNS